MERTEATRETSNGAVVVRIPGPLRALTDGRQEVEVQADTVDRALTALLQLHPGLRRHIRSEDGGLRDYVNIFLNEEDIRILDGVDTAVRARDTVMIVPSIAGG